MLSPTHASRIGRAKSASRITVDGPAAAATPTIPK
jgi:hypothetical protein